GLQDLRDGQRAAGSGERLDEGAAQRRVALVAAEQPQPDLFVDARVHGYCASSAIETSRRVRAQGADASRAVSDMAISNLAPPARHGRRARAAPIWRWPGRRGTPRTRTR